MKNLLLIVTVFYSGISLFSQIKLPYELKLNLEGKESFQEIKSTVTSFYQQQLSQLEAKDSVERKSIMRQLKHWNRNFWINEYYVDESGKTQDRSGIDIEILQKLKENIRANSNHRNQSGTWWQDGPINCTFGIGRIDEIAFHPSNPNIIYAGSPHGGLFKTIDGGSNWFPLSEYLPSLGVSGIAIHPTNPDIIYVLTGDGDSNGGCFQGSFCLTLGTYVSEGKGVYKSTDGGNTWQLTGSLSSTQFVGRELAIDPSNPNVLLAATSVGLYRTDNGGATWTTSLGGSFWDVKFNVINSNIVYLADNNTVFSCNDNGLFNNFTTFNIPSANRISIGVTAANPLRVYILAGPALSNTTFRGIFTSTDGGSTYNLVTQTPNLFSNTIGGNVFNDQSDYDNCITVSPTNENIIYVGGLSVWNSTDGGQNWSQISAYWPANNPYSHPDVHELSINPLNQTVYCGNDGGFYRLNNTNWDYLSTGLTLSQFYHFELGNASIPDWGGCQDNGIIRQSVYGNLNYNNITFGDGYDVLSDHPWQVSGGESNDAYSTVNNSIVRNNSNISVPGNQSFFGNLGMHPTDQNIIYVGYSQGVYQSNDKGANWTIIGAAGDWTVEMCKSEPGKFYAAGSGNIWRRNTDNTWTDITPPPPYNSALKISGIDVDPNDEDNVAICIGGLSGAVKVFHSFNGGTNWFNITYNLPNVPIFCIKRDAEGGFYIGTSVGVFYKRIFSGIWEYFSNGLPPTPVTEIQMEIINNNGTWEEGNHVHCSTFGRGMWKSLKYSSYCESELNLSINVKGPRNFQADNQIFSTSQILGGEGTNVKYSASNKITLQPGFKASLGTKFKTYLQGCNGL